MLIPLFSRLSRLSGTYWVVLILLLSFLLLHSPNSLSSGCQSTDKKGIWKLSKKGCKNLSFQSPQTSLCMKLIFCVAGRWLLTMAVGPLFFVQLKPVLQMLQLLTSKNWLMKLTVGSDSMTFNSGWCHKQVMRSKAKSIKRWRVWGQILFLVFIFWSLVLNIISDWILWQFSYFQSARY